MCGGTILPPTVVVSGKGLSPRVRGNPLPRVKEGGAMRSIPACAGEPDFGDVARPVRGVYPRVCGGTVSDASYGERTRGLSPRVRGNPGHHQSAATGRGVYPRVCGGTGEEPMNRRHLMGLSPRVRGNHELLFTEQWRLRSIPACAGEPQRPLPLVRRPTVYPRVCGGTFDKRRRREDEDGVYPRVCGGTMSYSLPSSGGSGLSPRVRGNLNGHFR